jgi:ADP-ribose pyrophosphatase
LVPCNPVGRTGIIGRGHLGRWGPNHAADPIVTCWKRDNQGRIVNHSVTNMPILQFVGIRRKDTGQWAIPGVCKILHNCIKLLRFMFLLRE